MQIQMLSVFTVITWLPGPPFDIKPIRVMCANRGFAIARIFIIAISNNHNENECAISNRLSSLRMRTLHTLYTLGSFPTAFGTVIIASQTHKMRVDRPALIFYISARNMHASCFTSFFKLEFLRNCNNRLQNQ